MTNAINTVAPIRDRDWGGLIVGGMRSTAATIRRLLVTMVERRCEKRMQAALYALDRRMLKDIGISRCEIPYAVHHGRRLDKGDGGHTRKDKT